METSDSLSSSLSDEQTQPGLIAPPHVSRAQKLLRGLGWTLFGLFCLILFTVLKLPEIRIKNYLQGMISSTLATQGMTFSAAETDLSMGFGISYEMKDVTLNPPPPQPSVKIEQIKVSPALLSLLLGKAGGSVKIKNGDGDLKAAFSMSGALGAAMGSGGPREFSTSYELKDMNLGKLGVLALAAGIQGSVVASGDGSIAGDLNSPQTWNGTTRLNLSRIVIEQQTLNISGMPISVPRLTISEGQIEVAFNQGKATVRSLKLGKPGNANDDIIATITGDILLGKQWQSSTLNLRTRFNFSQKILKSFVLIDALLGAGKQGDGGYAFNLTGPILAPNPSPIPGQ